MTSDESWRLGCKSAALHLRARLIRAVRGFFLARGYLEVETPLRIPSPLPETHIDAVPSEAWFLQTSPEVCMKRLLGAGYDRIFQIGKCFRRGERGERHLPEFTMLEWYCRGADYQQAMETCEALLAHLGRSLRRRCLSWGGRRIPLSPPWDRLTVHEAFVRYAGIAPEEALREDRFDKILALAVEPHLGWERPLLLYDYPLALASLARRNARNPAVAERFEVYVGGMELANAFSELADPEEQRRRFAQARQERIAAGRPPYVVSEAFLAALPRMGEAAGAALGVDRLAMLFSGARRIDEVVAFPPEDL